MQIRRRVSIEVRRPGVVFLAIFSGVVALDQITKALIRGWLATGETYTIWANVFDITHVKNEGAAFGLLPGQRAWFIGTSLVVLAGIAVYWFRERPRSACVVVAMGLVSSGAVGNLIDRSTTGLVTDFIDVFGRHFPVFNVADSALVVGVGLLVVWVLFSPEPELSPDGDSDAEMRAHDLPHLQDEV